MFKSLRGKPRNRSRKITLERLEDRIVLDAAIAVAVDDQQNQQDQHTSEVSAQVATKTVEQSAEARTRPIRRRALLMTRPAIVCPKFTLRT